VSLARSLRGWMPAITIIYCFLVGGGVLFMLKPAVSPLQRDLGEFVRLDR
jgi:hypothetical protein